MCSTCGCHTPQEHGIIRIPGKENHDHVHPHSHSHEHLHDDDESDHSHDGVDYHDHKSTHSYSENYSHHHHAAVSGQPDHHHHGAPDHPNRHADSHHHRHTHRDSDHHQQLNVDSDNHHHHGAPVNHHHHVAPADHQNLHLASDDHHLHEIRLEQDVLSKNNMLAERNRGYFEAKDVFAVNIVSSPGAGKTTLLERTIREMKEKYQIFVIEGDQQTMNDANRIDKAGAKVAQVNTGSGCHLDAHMVNHAVKELEITEGSVLLIENVGNLVCPALFDLGESKRVVIVSVTEGEDKPQKYPYIFENAELCIINKSDLLPHVDFDTENFKKYASHLNKKIQFIELSASKGDGLEAWYSWITESKHSSGS